MSNSKKKVSKKLIGWLVVASILVIAIIVVAFIIFNKRENNKKDKYFDSGSVLMTYSENSNIFFIDNMVPLVDDIAKASNIDGHYYDFTINVDLGDSKAIDYEIGLLIDDEFTSSLPETVKIYLEKQESGTYIPVSEPITFDQLNDYSSYGASVGTKIIAKVSSEESVSHNYRLRMWLTDGTFVSPDVVQSFGVAINVYGKAR